MSLALLQGGTSCVLRCTDPDPAHGNCHRTQGTHRPTPAPAPVSASAVPSPGAPGARCQLSPCHLQALLAGTRYLPVSEPVPAPSRGQARVRHCPDLEAEEGGVWVSLRTMTRGGLRAHRAVL